MDLIVGAAGIPGVKVGLAGNLEVLRESISVRSLYKFVIAEGTGTLSGCGFRQGPAILVHKAPIQNDNTRSLPPHDARMCRFIPLLTCR